jgi:hypothetical protein
MVTPQDRRMAHEAEQRALHTLNHDRRRVAQLEEELEFARRNLEQSEGVHLAARLLVASLERPDAVRE